MTVWLPQWMVSLSSANAPVPVRPTITSVPSGGFAGVDHRFRRSPGSR